MNLPQLPDLDFANEETLQASADNRASVALNIADSPLYFRGLEMRLTISIKSLFFMLMRLDGSAENGDDRTERDAIILLYLSTQPKAKWTDPRKDKLGRTLTPLRTRPMDWLAEIDEWADEAFGPDDMREVIEVVNKLLEIHHAPRPVIDDDSTGMGAMGNGGQNQPGKPD